MGFNLEYFKEALGFAVEYAPVTIKLALISFAISVLIGIVIATVRFYKIPVLSQFFSLFVTIYMGIPVMVALVIANLLFFTCYADIAASLHINTDISEVNPVILAYIVLILSYSCYCSESIRGAFNGIEKIQFEAGYSIGLTKIQTLRKIILPQMLPIMIPGLINNMVGSIKGTNLVSAIGVTEVMVAALVPCGDTYSYLEGYVAAALVYWAIAFVAEQLAGLLEKCSGKFRKRLA